MRCPKCGEDRAIETVTTGTTVEAFCQVCSNSWRVSEWAKALEVRNQQPSGERLC